MGWLLAMMKSHLFLAVLAFGLTVVSFAETGSTEASAHQKIILSYFHEVLDGGNADLVEKIFQPDCAIHFGSSNAHGIAGVRGVVENRKTTYSKLSTEIHDIFD